MDAGPRRGGGSHTQVMSITTAPGVLAPPVLRVLGPGQAPWPGLLVAGDPPTVWVDAADGPTGAAWRAPAGGHLLAPRDVARTAEGVALVVDHCPYRLAEAIARRGDLSPGEAVTIAVSVLRGAADALRLGEADIVGGEGSWWVSAEGRPLLALRGAGDPPHEGAGLWRSEAVRLLGELPAAAGPSPRLEAALVRARAELDGVRSARDIPRLEDVEDDLFESAPAAPLRIDDGPMRARALTARHDPVDESAPAVAAGPLAAGLIALLPEQLVEQVGDAARGAVSWIAERREAVGVQRSSRRALRRRADRRGEDGDGRGGVRRRRAPLLVGAAVGIGVLAAGAFWPGELPSTAAGVGGSSTPVSSGAGPSVDGTASPTTAVEGGATASAELDEGAAGLATALLDAWIACADDPCRAALSEDPARIFPAGIATQPARSRHVSLLEDYGGVSVVRVDAEDDSAPSQIVVIVRDGAEWRLREVYDITPAG